MAFELHYHEVTARFVEHAVVPPYEGSMIRGAFGRAFKDSCCPFPHENGTGCPLADKCPYAYVFESSPPPEARDFAKNKEVPRPYLFEPPGETKMEYEPGEVMRFGFTTVGRATDYMPYFVYAFSKMGETGVGRKRARYELEDIVAGNPLTGDTQRLYEGGTVRNVRVPAVWEHAEEAAKGLDGERLRLEFLTPAHVKHGGKVSSEAPSFAALVRNLLIRIPMLSAMHCGETWREDFGAMAARAAEVETVRDHTTWVGFRRYSAFRGRSESLEGIVGEAEYAGPLTEFLPLLVMGQLVHVGKRAVFGLGRYRIRASTGNARILEYPGA